MIRDRAWAEGKTLYNSKSTGLQKIHNPVGSLRIDARSQHRAVIGIKVENGRTLVMPFYSQS
jgi:hypothetical protein